MKGNDSIDLNISSLTIIIEPGRYVVAFVILYAWTESERFSSEKQKSAASPDPWDYTPSCSPRAGVGGA
jgi:hypothetical protein